MVLSLRCRFFCVDVFVVRVGVVVVNYKCWLFWFVVFRR